MIMHPSIGHGVLAKTFEVCSCALEQQHLRVESQLTSMFWVLGLVSSILASIYSDIKTLPVGGEQGKQQLWA
jgi:hypothetical protein